MHTPNNSFFFFEDDGLLKRYLLNISEQKYDVDPTTFLRLGEDGSGKLHTLVNVVLLSISNSTSTEVDAGGHVGKVGCS